MFEAPPLTLIDWEGWDWSGQEAMALVFPDAMGDATVIYNWHHASVKLTAAIFPSTSSEQPPRI